MIQVPMSLAMNAGEIMTSVGGTSVAAERARMRSSLALPLLSALTVFACSAPAVSADSSEPSSSPGENTLRDENAEPSEDFVVTHVSLFQSLEIPIFPQKDVSDVPVIANKDSLVRVQVRPGASGAKVSTLTLAVVLDDRAAPIVGTPTIVTGTGETTLDVKVPASELKATAMLQVKLLPDNAPATARGTVGTWPIGGGAEALGAQVSGAMHVVIVPVNVVKSAKFGQPNVGPEIIEDFRKYALALFPIGSDQLTLETHATHDTQLTPKEDFDTLLLDELAQLHTKEGAGNEVRYFGLYDFDDDAFEIDLTKASSLFGGRAYMPSAETVMNHATTHPVGVGRFRGARNDLSARRDNDSISAERIADWEKCPVDVVESELKASRPIERAYGVVTHELGHSYSLKHVSSTIKPFDAPEADETFPRANGTIGRTGWDSRTGRFFLGTCFTDMMAYANMQWISDHNYRKLHELIRGR